MSVRSVSRSECLAFDSTDPIAQLREQFVLPEDVVYLDGNSLGALPRSTAAAVARTVAGDWGDGLIRSWNDAGWVELPQRVGAKIARVVGAREADVIACDSTSVNLFKVLSAALSIQRVRRPTRTTIVSERGNFPTDLYIAQGLAAFLNGSSASGYSLTLVDGPDELASALALDPAVVMLTHVNYRTGAMHDMTAITDAIHRSGALAIWDLAHSAGAVPVDLDGSGADYAIGCGYKYLNGGPGAPAFLWVAPRHQDVSQQPLSGWFGHQAPFAFEPDYRPASGITRFLCGTPSVVALTALECGIDTVLSADAFGGIATLRSKSVALCELFITLVEASIPREALTLASPRAASGRGSQVSFRATRATDSGYAMMQALIAGGVIGDFRAPDILRFGFTPLYTRFEDVWTAAATLSEVVASRSWDQARFHAAAKVT